MRYAIPFVAVCACLVTAPAADLSRARAEPDLNKRAELAMQNADAAMNQAGSAYEAGDSQKGAAALADLRASVELACDSLRETRKPARNNKYYKRVELNMRTLLRHLDDLSRAVSYDDRASVDAVQKRLQELHDQILIAIMSKRK